MIVSFADRDTEKAAFGIRVKKFEAIAHTAQRKLRVLRAAGSLGDLRVPPGNRLEALAGDRQGQYSMRINDQYRICLRFEEGNAYDVEIVDYHS